MEARLTCIAALLAARGGGGGRRGGGGIIAWVATPLIRLSGIKNGKRTGEEKCVFACCDKTQPANVMKALP